VVTGVQIHNWAEEFDSGEPNLEWVAPVNVYAVVNGQRHNIDLSSFPVSRGQGALARWQRLPLLLPLLPGCTAAAECVMIPAVEICSISALARVDRAHSPQINIADQLVIQSHCPALMCLFPRLASHCRSPPASSCHFCWKSPCALV
jgi:hypothetical protein